MKIAEEGAPANDAERVDISITATRPVFEGDSKLDRAAGHAQKLALVEAKEPVKRENGREGSLTDSDGRNLFRLDQGDVEQGPQLLRQGGGGDPTGSATTGDDNLLDGLRFHGAPFVVVSTQTGTPPVTVSRSS